jgi:hypothetical protein
LENLHFDGFLIPPDNFKVTKNSIGPKVSFAVVQSQLTGRKVILVLLVGQKESNEGNK